jgi:hypothetical protein
MTVLRATVLPRPALREKSAAAKSGAKHCCGRRPMIAIATIAVFLGVVIALNIWEFGRID